MVAEQGGKLFFQRLDLSTNVERLFQRFDGVMQEGIKERHIHENTDKKATSSI